MSRSTVRAAGAGHRRRETDTPTRRPRILHVATIPMSTVFLGGQVGFMKTAGFDVHVLTAPGADLDRFGAEEEVPVHAVPMARRITPVRDLLTVREIARVIRRIRPDLVHAHTPKGGLLGMIAARWAGTPATIYHMRGLPMLTARGAARALLANTERVACGLAHRVICNSHSLRRVAVDEGICPTDKIVVLGGGSGNGVDATGRFDPDRQPPDIRAVTRRSLGIPADARVVGFVGRLVRDKGIVELVEAWSTLRELYPDLHLLVVGPFEPRDPVPDAIAALLRSDRRIHLVGMEWNTPPLYAAMDVVALPSYREGFPNVPLEGAAMRRPVVTTRVPGCVDAVADGQTGMLVPAGDARALADALETYVTQPALAQRHGQKGRERVLGEFRQEAIWEALEAEYRRLLARRTAIRSYQDREGSTQEDGRTSPAAPTTGARTSPPPRPRRPAPAPRPSSAPPGAR